MPGHSLEIQIKSAGQIDSITLTADAVDLLMPGTPAETVEQARAAIEALITRSVELKREAIVEAFYENNVTVAT